MDVVEIEINDAIRDLEASQAGFDESWDYYNANPRDFAVGLSTPPALRNLLAQIGIPRIYVHALAERLIIEGFRRGDKSETDEELWSWFKVNNLDTASQLSFRDVMIYGRGYITISAPDENNEDPLAIPDAPVIKVESPLSLYAKVNPKTNRVEYAVRAIKDESGQILSSTLYLPDRTEFYEPGSGGMVLVDTNQHGLGVVPVVPITHSMGVSDIYGTSIITPEIKSITDSMSRLMMNLQTTSELMAAPQRMIFGSSVDEINPAGLQALELYTSSYLVVEDPAAKAMQLPAADLRNYTEAMAEMTRKAAAYTGLPPQYLSFSQDNPASAEAINSSENRLVRTCETLADMFGNAWEQAMRIAQLVMGNTLTVDDFRMETVFRDPTTPTYASKADAASKLYAAGNGVIPLEQARIDMGYTPEQRRQMREWDKENLSQAQDALYGPGIGGVNEPEPDGEGATAERPSDDEPNPADSGSLRE